MPKYDVFQVLQGAPVQFGPVSLVCPLCGQMGTFEKFYDGDFQNIISGGVRINIGLRRCPKETCKYVVLVAVQHADKKIIFQFPPSRIKFEVKNIPEDIVKTLKEAIECHANKCWRAGAAMVRRTLEEICDDKGVEGKDLFDRIEALKSQVVIAPALFEAMHEIRFLGNDAVHIELKWFDDVGEEELLVAIKLTTKIIEAIYQSDDLLNELKALKKPPTTP